jgi:MHS family proline/betaine transporter-like MFS transporter
MTHSAQTLRASAYGNFLEWFDFTLYGFFALAIGSNFFPSSDPMLSALASYTALAAGFLMRPIGAVVMGSAADKRGRKPVLLITFALMGLSTLMVVCAPPYSMYGVAGPVMVIVARLLAGFAAAGETGAAAALAIEASPPDQRGRWGAWFSLSTYLGLAAGAGVALLCYGAMGSEQTNDWGWRLGYGVGLLILPFGWWARSRLIDGHQVASQQVVKQGRMQVIGMTLRVAGLTAYGTSVVYVVIVFMPTFALKQLGIAQGTSALTSMLASTIVGVAALAGGRLADRMGRKKVMFIGLLTAVLTSTPLFAHMLANPGTLSLVGFQWACAAGLGLFAGGSLPLMVESFSPGQRALGVGLGYNLGVMIFGAMGPVVNTLALSRGYIWAPLFYLMGTTAVTAITLFVTKDTSRGVEK